MKYFDPDGRVDQESTEHKIQRIKGQYELMIIGARVKGWNVAAGNMKHFLNGTGDLLQIDSEWLQKQTTVQKAISVNISRYDAQFQSLAENMKNGTSITINEYPTNPSTAYGPFGNKMGFATQQTAPIYTDLFYASGTFTLTTFCNVTISKGEDGKVSTKGTLLHIWWDTYDWHDNSFAEVPGFGNVKDEDANFLVKTGNAAPFIMRSNWSTEYEKTF